MKHNDDAHLSDVSAERIFALTRPDDKLMTLYIIYSILSTVGIIFTLLPLYFRFKTLRYRFDKDGVAVSYGLLWRKESYLTYARIQDIHVSRNIFERWLGLGTVEIQTAAGSSSSQESIVGVKEYDAIRNFLYARMRGHKLIGGEQPALEEVPPVEDALAGIRDELRSIRELMEVQRDV